MIFTTSARLLEVLQDVNTGDREAAECPMGRAIKEEGDIDLIAYSLHKDGPSLASAPATRPWMDELGLGFANRCLPIRMANQAGWLILNDRKLEIMWRGGESRRDTTIKYYKKYPTERLLRETMFAKSHFGGGIVTWQIPYLFRTSPGYNLWVRGPSNFFKDGICPMDGIVESDWTTSTFTMNWKITRAEAPIQFDVGEPICMILPYRRTDPERVRPALRKISDDPRLEQQCIQWRDSRERFNWQQERTGDMNTWQKEYFRGTDQDGKRFDGHQTSLKLRKFLGRSDMPEAEDSHDR